MHSFSRTFQVAAPRERLFAYLADFASTEQWDVNVARAEKLTAGLPREGSAFAVYAAMGGFDLRMDYRIVTLRSPEELVLTGTGGGLVLRDRFTFVALDNQNTQVTYELEAAAGGLTGLALRLLPGSLARMIDRAVAGLQYAFSPEPETVKPASTLADKLIVPGMARFPRAGFRAAKRHWKGLAVDAQGRRVVITGATSGIGRAAALALAKQGAELLVVGRSQDKLDDLVAWLQQETGQSAKTVKADLSSIEQTRCAADSILQQWPTFDVLINNAGALFNERALTDEGFERSFVTLLLSPFVLTESLLPALMRSEAGARVINVTSGGMYTQGLHLQDLNYEQGRYDGPTAYARAKRGLVDVTEVWARRFSAGRIGFHAMHPGWADTQGVRDSLPGFHKVTRRWLRTPAEGADTAVWLALSPAVQGRSGELWLDRQPHVSAVFPGTQSSIQQQEALYERLQELRLRFEPQGVVVQDTLQVG